MNIFDNVDSGALNATMSRFLVWGIIIVCIIYDLLAFLLGWKTISATIREADFQTGTLIRWLLLGVWLHLFVSWGSRGYGN